VLDQTVLNQPHVAAAIERNYVPIKIDAEAQPALRNWFKITHVPAEVVVTPEGNVVATLSPPENPDAYIAQAENLARHFRQMTPGATAPQGAAVNAAYAGLPVGRTPSVATNPYSQGPGAPGSNAYASGTPPRVAIPQGQSNPYVTSPSGQIAVSTNTPQAQTAATGNTALVSGAAGAGPSMPANAMPASYRPMFAGPPTDAGANATGAPPNAAPTGEGYAALAGASNSPYTGPATSGIASSANGIAASAAGPAVAPPAGQVAITPPQGAAVQTAQPPLPTNCPPVAFDGCCPVTLKTLNKWTPGNRTYGAIHRGRTYLFAGETQRQQFLADPDGFSPVFAGYDPVLLLEQQQTVPGSRKFGFRYAGSFYLFSSRETMAKFEASPHTYAAGVRQAMARVDASTDGVFRR
jgi:YHS domain-containing protein